MDAKWRKFLILLIILVGASVFALLICEGVLFKELCYLPPDRLESSNGLNWGVFETNFYEIRRQRFTWIPGPCEKRFRISQDEFTKLESSGLKSKIYL